MANFNKYIPLLTEFEGGYVDDPDDLGGATNMGITYRTFVDYLHKKGLSANKDKFKSMTIDLRNQIIKSEYWDKCKGDEIKSQSVAVAIVDWFVNSGYNATMAVQKLLNLKRDGIIGNITLSEINKQDAKKLFEAIQKERVAYIYRIVEQREENRKFLNGWSNRINKIKFAD